MAALLTAIARSRDLSRVAKAYERACIDQVLRGGAFLLRPAPVVLGRAVERDRFFFFLLLRCDYFGGREEEVRDFIDALIAGSPLEGGQAAVLMSINAAWVTWDPDDSTQDPFAFAGNAAGKVRACLGLDPDAQCAEGLLLLVYELPGRAPLFRPTVADAGVFLFFEPPPSTFTRHGLTMPWPPGLSGAYEPRPLPEALHRSLPVQFLKLPIGVTFG